LLIVGIVIAPFALYAADRLIKMRAQARKLRRINARLAAATARADEQEARRQAAIAASAELTSVVPAIKLPPPSLPGLPHHGPAKPKSRDRVMKADHAAVRSARRASRTGEHQVRSTSRDGEEHRRDTTGPHRTLKPRTPQH
jgi:hypothetical protein